MNDFGLARIRPKASALMHTQCGTPNWQGKRNRDNNCIRSLIVSLICRGWKTTLAPEFWSSNPSYTEKVDVYACGLIFWEILTWGAYGYPFQGTDTGWVVYNHILMTIFYYADLSEHALYIQVKEHDVRPPTAKLFASYPKSLLLLITEMWQHESFRVSVREGRINH